MKCNRIGERIAAIRKEHGLTQRELAQKVGVSHGHIGRIETGKYTMRIDTLQRIADVFNMEVELIKRGEN